MQQRKDSLPKAMVLPDYLMGMSCPNPYKTTFGEPESVCRDKCVGDDMCDFYTHYDILETEKNVCHLSSECKSPYKNKHAEMTYAKTRALSSQEPRKPAPPPKSEGFWKKFPKIPTTYLWLVLVLIILGVGWKMWSGSEGESGMSGMGGRRF